MESSPKKNVRNILFYVILAILAAGIVLAAIAFIQLAKMIYETSDPTDPLIVSSETPFPSDSSSDADPGTEQPSRPEPSASVPEESSSNIPSDPSETEPLFAVTFFSSTAESLVVALLTAAS